ncbi:DUF2721 domain-containing protein [uncultured Algibacter sp.]|uniref:DUF2721 domain-containing protein n=1 Tax=uncultured Algibacter sp. TaxID=298659 RepID=UPI00260FC592|nr:DUF2721 domain-containing protein [uncultured Algibacter sp.]
MQEWYVPITILPGICLLILSTSNIMIDLSREIKVLINENEGNASTLIERKLNQLKLINSAMALLYLSVVNFVLSALFSGLKENVGWNFKGDIYVLFLGILVAILALLSLMLYSFRAVKLRQDQYHKTC